MSKPAPSPSAASEVGDADRRIAWSLRMQLMVGVNAVMALMMTVALIVDYRRELSHHLRHEKSALLAEAECVAAALNSLDHIDARSIQRLLDSIQKGIDLSGPGRYRLRVEWNGQSIESSRTGRQPQSEADFQKLVASRPSGDTTMTWDTETLAIGMCTNQGIAAYVIEPVESMQREIGYETLERLVVLVIAGLVAMGIVDIILYRALVRPLEQLSRAVESIGAGQLGTQVPSYRTSDLEILGRAINTMSSRLAAHEKEVHQQMSKARRLQQHLLPPWPAIPGMTVERRFLPATEVTGDYHAALPLGAGEWIFCIADVTGHGIPAAMTAAMLNVLFQQAAEQSSDPQQILTALNTQFGAVVMPGDFATMLVIHWQPREQRIRYANGGHEPGLLLRHDGTLVQLESDGLMVGAIESAHWELHVCPIEKGDRLFMYTDGAIEAFNPQRELFGKKRLIEAFLESRTVSPKMAVTQIIQRLDDFRGDRAFADDVSLVMLEFVGADSAQVVPVSQSAAP